MAFAKVGDMTTKLQKVRNEYGASLKGLAESSGVALSTLEGLDAGRIDIDKSRAVTVYRISKALGCKVSDILEDVPRVRRAPKRLRALPKKD